MPVRLLSGGPAPRVGQQCETADQGRLQEALKPRSEAADVLVVEGDGSQLPIRGAEPWKEAQLRAAYRTADGLAVSRL